MSSEITEKSTDSSDVDTNLQSAALLAVEVHRTDRLMPFDNPVYNPFGADDTVALREVKWQEFLALIPKYDGLFFKKRINVISGWLKDANGPSSIESAHMHCFKLLIDRQQGFSVSN